MIIVEFRPFIQHHIGLKKKICQKRRDLRLKTREMALVDAKELRGYPKNLKIVKKITK